MKYEFRVVRRGAADLVNYGDNEPLKTVLELALAEYESFGWQVVSVASDSYAFTPGPGIIVTLRRGIE